MSVTYGRFLAAAYLSLGCEAVEDWGLFRVYLIITDPLVTVQLASGVHNREGPEITNEHPRDSDDTQRITKHIKLYSAGTMGPGSAARSVVL